jgi:hypothetical protein
VTLFGREREKENVSECERKREREEERESQSRAIEHKARCYVNMLTRKIGGNPIPPYVFQRLDFGPKIRGGCNGVAKVQRHLSTITW